MNTLTNPLILVDFNESPSTDNWYIVDDVVMGGRSSGSFNLSPQGYGVFEGQVSLENNGGFSSVQYRMGKTDLNKYQKFVIRLKGDGKRYQFRIKDSADHYYSYISYFSTTGDWQTVEIPFGSMYPSFRGRELNMSNFSGDTMDELAFLIANKRAESFQLMIDRIELY